VDFIQIREKDLPDRKLFELTRKAVSLVRGTESKVLVNGRADIALSAGAHGVHLPSVGLKAHDIREWLPDGFWVGESIHTLRELRRACDQNVDYVLLGHVFPTESKQKYGSPLGLDFLKKICDEASLPVFALGGMRAERIESVLKAGAVGIAGISLFQKQAEFSKLPPHIGSSRNPSA
jgi:thiamine-phosphate pyrophosphorylase